MSAWGRRKAATDVYLNVYDMSPGNEYMHQFGLGVFHSGVEVHGVEWTFSGGSGVFSMTPKVVPGDQQVTFRESVHLGTTTLSSREVESIISELKPDFPPDSYNLLSKNCNVFADEFVKRLLKRSIPGYVNRLAYLGSFLSCLLPPSMLGQAPVDGGGGAGAGGGASSGGGRAVTAGRPAARARAAPAARTFSGPGMSLASSGGGSALTSSAAPAPSGGGGGGGGGGGESDPARARREMLAKAALARQQRAQQRREQEAQQGSASAASRTTAGELRRR